MKFVLFKKSLEEGAAPVYLFDGEEEYFKERGEEMLKEKFLGEPSLNYTSFRGETLKGDAISSLIAAAESFPFMSEKRIVKVTDFYPTEREYTAYLKKYIENPQSTTILLIVNSDRSKGKSFDLKKVKGITWVDCSKADEDTVLRWIFTQFKRNGIAIDTECCERIMRYCLADMSRIVGETQKLLAYAGKGKTITGDDVDAIVYRDADYKIYEMTNALGMRNFGKYETILTELLGKGMDEMGVLNSLCSYFRNMFEIALLHKPDAETAAALGMKEYAVKMSRRQAEAFGHIRVKSCYFRILDTVNAVKSGKISPQGALLKVNAHLFFEEKANIAE